MWLNRSDIVFSAVLRHYLDCARHVSFMAPCRKKKVPNGPMKQENKWYHGSPTTKQVRCICQMAADILLLLCRIEDAMSWYEKPRHEDDKGKDVLFCERFKDEQTKNVEALLWRWHDRKMREVPAYWTQVRRVCRSG